MKKTKKPMVFRRESVPQGRSIKVNLKLADTSLEIFKKMKQRQACKTNSEVFNYIYKFASESDLKELINETEKPETEQSKQWRTFTINEYILGRLRKLSKKHEISPDTLVGITLSSMQETVRQGLEAVRRLREAAKYTNEDDYLRVIGDIWEKVSQLRDALDLWFPLEYDEYDGSDPENYHNWLGDIENGLQELEDLVPKLFAQKAAKKPKPPGA